MYKFAPLTLCLVAATSVSVSGPAQAATFFSNDLTAIGGTANDGGLDDSTDDGSTNTNLNAAGFEAGLTPGSRVEFGTAGATFGLSSSGDSGRNYIRTVDEDYHLADFTAEITFTASNTATQAIFFGLGTGEPLVFGLPDIDPDNDNDNTTAVLAIGSGGNSLQVFLATVDGPNPFPPADPGNIPYGTDSHTVIMDYDADAATLTYTLDVNSDGTLDGFPIVADVSSQLAQWTSGERASIYFGGDDGVVISNFSVVPEPGSLALLGLGGLALIRRRR
ncbi:MAG: PEP-CTERM sorting domain-containing protein [Planctomycetota bacterium]